MVSSTFDINDYLSYITLGLGIVVIILFILVIVAFKSLNSLEKKYRKLTRGANNKNIEEVIHSYMDKVDTAVANSEATRKLLDQTEKKLKKCIQKVSIVRYRAFDDVGSDLSFSIAILDSDNSGVIVTGIYGRNDSTTYAKPIDKGISRYDLSEEEQRVLRDAINN